MSRKLMLLLLGMSVVMVFASGCASIVGGGGSQNVTFNSSPDGATVAVNGLVMGKTPLTTTVKRTSSQVVRFEKEGYDPIEKDLTTHLNPWFWGNILIGGLVGSSTDGLTGAIYEYMPDHYLVTLTPAGRIRAISSGMDSRKSNAKSYIVTNYGAITSELSGVPGEYLNALYALLEIPEPERQAAHGNLKQLSDDTKDIAVFANDVVNTYIH